MNIPGVSPDYLAQKLMDISVMSSALTLKMDFLTEGDVENIEDIALLLALTVRSIVEKEELEELFALESER